MFRGGFGLGLDGGGEGMEADFWTALMEGTEGEMKGDD